MKTSQLPEKHEPFTDKYFLRSKEILQKDNINPIVRYRVFARKAGNFDRDESIEIIENLRSISAEPPIKGTVRESIGIGVIEAPRGTLYYKLEIDAKGVVKRGEIVVPTGQNQVIMERAIREIVEDLLKKNAVQEKIIYEVEKFIRAFDPCMSCASHFLKVRWS